MNAFGKGLSRSALVLVAALATPALLAGCSNDDSPSRTDAAPPSTSSSSSPTSTAITSDPLPPTCPVSGLMVTPGVTDGASGLRVMNLDLTNCGSQTRTISGYPALTLLDEDRQPFDDVEVLHGAEPIYPNDGFCTSTGTFDPGPQPVTLAPGEQAVTLVVWRNLTTDTGGLVLAPTLTVTPIDGTPPQDVTPDGPIDLGTTGRLGISAWIPKADTVC